VPNDTSFDHLTCRVFEGRPVFGRKTMGKQHDVSEIQGWAGAGKGERRRKGRCARMQAGGKPPGVARARARLCGSECVGYITGRMPSSLSLALIVVATTRSSSTCRYRDLWRSDVRCVLIYTPCQSARCPISDCRLSGGIYVYSAWISKKIRSYHLRWYHWLVKKLHFYFCIWAFSMRIVRYCYTI